MLKKNLSTKYDTNKNSYWRLPFTTRQENGCKKILKNHSLNQCTAHSTKQQFSGTWKMHLSWLTVPPVTTFRSGNHPCIQVALHSSFENHYDRWQAAIRYCRYCVLCTS
jgi:hypothetical protein